MALTGDKPVGMLTTDSLEISHEISPDEIVQEPSKSKRAI